MAKLLQAFDSNQHEELAGFDPIPAGEYPMQITDSSLEKTKDYQQTKHQYIKLELTVLQGEFKGRKIWTNLNIINKNAKAVEIAQKELTSIIRACFGRDQKIEDTKVLHGKPMLVKVRIKPAKGDYPPQNCIVGYKPASAAATAQKPGAGKKVSKPAQMRETEVEQETETAEEVDTAGWDS